MNPPYNGNGHHVDPLGADHSALISAVSRGVAKLEAAEASFGRTAKTLVADSKAMKGDLSSVKDEVTDIKAVLLRVDAGQQRLEAKIGTYPLGEDLVKAMERESVRELSPEAIAERDAKLQAARYGTGLIGSVTRADAKLAEKDAEFEQRLSDMVKSEAKEAAQGVVTEAKDAAVTSNKSTLIKGGIGAVIIGIIMALGGVEGITSGAVRVIHAVQGRDLPAEVAPTKPAPEAQ